jgi:hypothetical protein
MTLKELLEQVKLENLQKGDLERLHTEFVNLYSQLMIEKSDIEQEEALFFLGHEYKTDIAAKRKWRGSHKGLRLIQLDNYEKVITKNLQSIKSRLYASVY